MARSETGSTKGTGSGELTPLLRQYMHIKSKHPDHILFFRCGDFYEMFHDDARLASQVLGITLTSRGTGPNGEPIALAGVPYHSVDPYLARLIRGGYRVAICEQMENPKYAKGVVKREVVRVVSPGTVLEDNLLDNKSNNYLVGIHEEKGAYGIAALDFSTGQFSITEFHGKRSKSDCASEMARLAPAEVVLAREQRTDLEDVFGWAPARASLVDAAESGGTPVLPRVTGNDGPLGSATRPPSIAAVDGAAQLFRVEHAQPYLAVTQTFAKIIGKCVPRGFHDRLRA